MLRAVAARSLVGPASRGRLSRALAGAAEVPPSPTAAQPSLDAETPWARVPRALASSMAVRRGRSSPSKVVDLGEVEINLDGWKRELSKHGVRIRDTEAEELEGIDADDEGAVDAEDVKAVAALLQPPVPFEYSNLPPEKNGKKLYFDSAGQPVYMKEWKDLRRMERYLQERPQKLVQSRKDGSAPAPVRMPRAIEAAEDFVDEDAAAAAGDQKKPRSRKTAMLNDRLVRANIDPAIFRKHKHDLYASIEYSRQLVAERRALLEGLRERTGVPVEAQMTLIEVLQILSDEKVFDVHVVETRRRTDHHTHDFLVFASCRTDRHARAGADRLCKALREKGVLIDGRYPPYVDGRDSDDWMVVDCELASVHFFTEEARRSYDVDSLWEQEKEPEAAFNPATMNPFVAKREAKRRHRRAQSEARRQREAAAAAAAGPAPEAPGVEMEALSA
eukprot:tig00020554_g10942.t1